MLSASNGSNMRGPSDLSAIPLFSPAKALTVVPGFKNDPESLNNSRPTFVAFGLDTPTGVTTNQRYRPSDHGPEEAIPSTGLGIVAPFIERTALTKRYNRGEYVRQLDIEDLFDWKSTDEAENVLEVGFRPTFARSGVPAVAESEREVGGIEAKAKVWVVLI